MSTGPSTADMKAWARRQMRTCKCGRKYIRPKEGNWTATGYYKSERKRPDICWRCERAEKIEPPAYESGVFESKIA